MRLVSPGLSGANADPAGPRVSNGLKVVTTSSRHSVPIEPIEVSSYTVPTDFPESDGTLEWGSTTLVLVEASGGGQRGLGYTYADISTAQLVQSLLAKIVQGHDALAVTARWQEMVRCTRNLGRPGIVSMAISAVDSALWDLKARLLNFR
jgi:L-alanine-DL-glutamate epimerase-like enolase superfamily enzyme